MRYRAGNEEHQENKASLGKMSLAASPPSPTIWKWALLSSALSPVPRTVPGERMHLCPSRICWMTVILVKKDVMVTAVVLLILVWVWRRPWSWSAFSSHNWASFLHWLSCRCSPVQHPDWTVTLLSFTSILYRFSFLDWKLRSIFALI